MKFEKFIIKNANKIIAYEDALQKVEDNFTVVDEKTKSYISKNKTNKLQKKLINL